MQQFSLDWKFNTEDIIENIKQIIPEFSVKFVETREESGEFYDIVKVGKREYKFKTDNEYENLDKIMEFMNRQLPSQQTFFELITPGDDQYTYQLKRK